MSRKSDLKIARGVYANRNVPGDLCFDAALEAAYDLGRAAQAVDCASYGSYPTPQIWCDKARRLRAKVRKMVEGSGK